VPIQQNFQVPIANDVVIVITLTPPQPIGNMDLQFQVCKRAGGGSMPLITKSCVSGFYGTSGMNILNSGQGEVSVEINATDTSGLDFGNLWYNFGNVQSGSMSSFTVGYISIIPG